MDTGWSIESRILAKEGGGTDVAFNG